MAQEKHHFTFVGQASRTKKPSFRLKDLSVIKSLSRSNNKRVTHSVATVEILRMYIYATEIKKANTYVAGEVQRQNGELSQIYGGNIWSITEGYDTVDITSSIAEEDEYETKQWEIYVPPFIFEYVEEEYGSRGWSTAISDAVEWYINQPFYTLHHVATVQRDILEETYETDVGQWFNEFGDEWIDNVESECVDDWSEKYKANTTKNTPVETKIQWLETAFEAIKGDSYVSKSVVKGMMQYEFGLSERDADQKIKKMDMDKINRGWYERVKHVVDDDVTDRFDLTPTKLHDLAGHTAHSLTDLAESIDGSVRENMTDEHKERMTKLATYNMPGECSYTDVSWAGRLAFATGDTSASSINTWANEQ